MRLTPAPGGYPIKLVRDHTPEIINSTGEPGDLWYGPLDGIPPEERGKWLRRKLIEEALEYAEDRSVEELADVLAVIEGLCQLHEGWSLARLIDLASNDERGGFLRGRMMYGRHPEYDT